MEDVVHLRFATTARSGYAYLVVGHRPDSPLCCAPQRAPAELSVGGSLSSSRPLVIAGTEASSADRARLSPDGVGEPPSSRYVDAAERAGEPRSQACRRRLCLCHSHNSQHAYAGGQCRRQRRRRSRRRLWIRRPRAGAPLRDTRSYQSALIHHCHPSDGLLALTSSDKRPLLAGRDGAAAGSRPLLRRPAAAHRRARRERRSRYSTRYSTAIMRGAKGFLFLSLSTSTLVQLREVLAERLWERVLGIRQPGRTWRMSRRGN